MNISVGDLYRYMGLDINTRVEIVLDGEKILTDWFFNIPIKYYDYVVTKSYIDTGRFVLILKSESIKRNLI